MSDATAVKSFVPTIHRPSEFCAETSFTAITVAFSPFVEKTSFVAAAARAAAPCETPAAPGGILERA